MARTATVTRTDAATTATREALAQAEATYREAWAAAQRAEALDAVRRSLPGLEQRVEGCRKELTGLEAWLAELETMHTTFSEELAQIDEQLRAMPRMAGQEEDRLVHRRSDLRQALAALEGASPLGTLVDHLAVEGKPRIPGTRRRIAEAREGLEKVEAELEGARREVEKAGG